MSNRALRILIFVGVIGFNLGLYGLLTLAVGNVEKIEKPNPEVNIYESKEVFFFECVEQHTKFQCAAYAESYFRGREE